MNETFTIHEDEHLHLEVRQSNEKDMSLEFETFPYDMSGSQIVYATPEEEDALLDFLYTRLVDRHAAQWNETYPDKTVAPEVERKLLFRFVDQIRTSISEMKKMHN